MDATDMRDASGHPLRWTDTAIVGALLGLLEGLGQKTTTERATARYPRKLDFCEAGLGGLHRTIQARPGGASAFAARIGCLPPLRGRPAARPTPRSMAARGAR